MPINNSESEIEPFNKLLAHFFECCIPDACIIFDEKFYVVKMNSKAEQLILLPKHYVMSKPLWEISPQYLNSGLFHAFQKIKEDGKELTTEICGSITNRSFKVTIQKFENYYITFIRDITPLKHAHNELLRAEERFSAIFRNSHVLMAIFCLENDKHISVNDCYANFFGYKPGEIIGQTKCQIYNTMDIRSVQAKEENQPDANTRSFLLSVKTRLNTYKTLIVSSEPININGKPCRLEIGIDITDNLRYQKELQRLEHLNILGQMSASIAHEIRNPLQTVKGFLQFLLLKDGIQPYQSHFHLMIDELNRANQIITEFLSLSRTKPTNFKSHNLNCIINSILPLIKAQALEEDKNIEVELSPIPSTLLDEDEVKQVILNIVKNALEASPVNEKVKIKTAYDERSIKLVVCDYGQGIPPEVQENIGMPFFTTKKNGTGLGLSMSFSILERHNAQLNFTSHENGTTFHIDFPIAE